MLLGAFMLTPGSWLAAARTWLELGVAWIAWVSAFNPELVAIVGVVALLVIALALAFAPPTTRRIRTIPARGTITTSVARISVYVDAENQPPTDLLPVFIERLRSYLDGRRADLFFYADAQRMATSSRYIQLRRFGFRPVDVSHNPFELNDTSKLKFGWAKTREKQDIANIVDIELSLHAARRALFPPHPQEIILVTADQDFIPLIYQLWADGHHIQLWASKPPQEYYDMTRYLDRFTVVDLRPSTQSVIGAPSEDAEPVALASPATTTEAQSQAPSDHAPTPLVAELPPPHSAVRRRWKPRPQANRLTMRNIQTAVAPSKPVKPAQRVTLELGRLLIDEDPILSGIRLTLIALNLNPIETGTVTYSKETLFSLIGLTSPVIARRLGYQGNHYATCWLMHAQHAGALAITWPPSPPVSDPGSSDARSAGTHNTGGLYEIGVGAVPVERASEHMRRFVQFVADAANTLRSTAADTATPLETLLHAVYRSPAEHDFGDLRDLMALLDPHAVQLEGVSPIIHLRFFCRCARALGMLAVEEGGLSRDRLIFTAQVQ